MKMLHLYSPMPFLSFTLLLLYIRYLYMLQSQRCDVIIISLYNFIYFKELEKSKESNFIPEAFVIQPLYLVSSFVPIDSNQHLSHFLRPNAASLPPISFVLLLANILHLYVLQVQQYNYMHSVFYNCYSNQLRGKNEKKEMCTQSVFYSYIITSTCALCVSCGFE